MSGLPSTSLSDPFAAPASDGVVSVSEESALVQLRAYILENAFRKGDRLPPERQLGPELGLRRSELRRALETLASEGVLWRHVGKGTFVASHPDQPRGGDLGGLARRLSPADVMRARAAFEPAIAREAALEATATAIGALRLTAERARAAATWREYEALDNDFHRQIAEAAGSMALVALFDQLNTLRRMVTWGRLVRSGPRPPADHPSFDEHDGIVAALSDRDPDAAQARMRAHLRSVEDRLSA
jgi:DNA-binding FadR family transcriptional regulator